MNKIESNIAQLKGHLESAAFMVSKGGEEKEAHSEIVQCLIVLSEFEGLLGKYRSSEPDKSVDIREVNKVNRRLKLWAKRPNQINSKILSAFLKLQQSGFTTITESSLKAELPELESFETNFLQMKIIAENNHGKVFEQYGNNISLWDPVVVGIREYEKVVFG